jgi:hypothetical protein
MTETWNLKCKKCGRSFDTALETAVTNDEKTLRIGGDTIAVQLPRRRIRARYCADCMAAEREKEGA